MDHCLTLFTIQEVLPEKAYYFYSFSHYTLYQEIVKIDLLKFFLE